MYTPPPGLPSNPMMSLRARLRPMGIGDILDETFRLYRENFALFVATVAVLEVPAQIINLLITLNAPPVPRLNTSNGTLTSQQLNDYFSRLGGSLGASGGGGLLISLVSIFITAAMAVVISNRYLNRTVTVGNAYRAAVDHIGSLIVAILWNGLRIVGIVIAIAIVVAVLVAVKLWPLGVLIGIATVPLLIYIAVAWTLVSQVIMLENAGGTGSSGRSRRLIQGYWWKTLGLLIVAALLVNILSSIPTIVIAGILGSGSGTGGTLIAGLIGLVIAVLIRPIQVAATTLLFYDLKIRKEAFDLEAMVQQAGGGAPVQY